MTIVTAAGTFPDVTFYDGALHVSRVNDRLFIDRLHESGELITIADFECGGSGFARLKTLSDGSLRTIYRLQTPEHDGTLVRMQDLTQGTKREYSGAFYNNPVVFGNHGYAIESLEEGLVKTYNLLGKPVTELSGLPTGSQGVYALGDDNRTITTNDQNRLTAVDVGMLNPERAEDVVTGETIADGPPFMPVHSYMTAKSIQLLQGRPSYVPKICAYRAPNGEPRWAIVTSDYATVSLVYDLSLADFGQVHPPIPVPPDQQPIRVKIPGPVAVGQHIVLEVV